MVSGCQQLGKWGWGVIANGSRVSSWGDGNIIKLIVVMVAQH